MINCLDFKNNKLNNQAWVYRYCLCSIIYPIIITSNYNTLILYIMWMFNVRNVAILSLGTFTKNSKININILIHRYYMKQTFSKLLMNCNFKFQINMIN